MATYKSELDRRAVATVWVGRLTKATSEDSLKEFFRDYANDITTIHLKPGERKGDQYAFVNFKSLQRAHQAQQELNMRPIDDCRSVLLRVNEELDQEHFRKQYSVAEHSMPQPELAPRHVMDMTLMYGQPPGLPAYPQPVSTAAMIFPPRGGALTHNPMMPPVPMHLPGRGMPSGHIPLEYPDMMIAPQAPQPAPPPARAPFNPRMMEMSQPLQRRTKEPIPGGNAAATIWLGRLPIYCEPDHISPHFEKFGQYVLDIRVRTNKKLQSCYAFVDFSDAETAKAACNHARKVEICGGSPTVKLYLTEPAPNGNPADQQQGPLVAAANGSFMSEGRPSPAELRNGGEVSPNSREYIWIGSLPPNTERSDVNAVFADFQSDIIDIRVRTNKKRQSCYAFVDFRTSSAARQAFTEAKSQMILGIKPTWKLTAGKVNEIGDGNGLGDGNGNGSEGRSENVRYDMEWPPLPNGMMAGPEGDVYVPHLSGMMQPMNDSLLLPEGMMAPENPDALVLPFEGMR